MPDSTLTIKFRSPDPAAEASRSQYPTVMKSLDGKFPFSDFFTRKLILQRALTPEGKPFLFEPSDRVRDDTTALGNSQSQARAMASGDGSGSSRTVSREAPQAPDNTVEVSSTQNGGDKLARTAKSFSLGIKVML